LPVERPARLLVVVRDREVPEDRWPGHAAISADVPRWRRYISAAQWDARRPAKASRHRATGAGSGPGGALGNSGGKKTTGARSAAAVRSATLKRSPTRYTEGWSSASRRSSDGSPF